MNNQFGFKRKHNTTMQLCRIINDIQINYNKDKVTNMVLLDFEKAFDQLWIEALVYKLTKLKITPPLVLLIHSYLKKRNFRVRVNGSLSISKNINAGVPQGSVLSPAFFNIYISDLPKFSKVNTAQYADDTAVYAHSFYAQAANL